MAKVLVVATSRKTRGGITAVVKAHEMGPQWRKYHCRWIQTHRDGPNYRKILYFIISLSIYLFILPFYDLVHIHVSSYPSLRRKMYYFKLAKLYGKKIVVHFHPSGPDIIFNKKTQPSYKYIFSNADRVVVLSPQWKRWVNEAIAVTDNVQYIYNPCPLVEKGHSDYSLKYILFAGTLCKRKGYDTLIAAFAKISADFPDWKLILAGNPLEERQWGDINSFVDSLGIKNRVIFPGWVSGPDKDRLFRNASIFCLASVSEGFPMAVLDAWAFGVPVVCTPVGGLLDVVKDGDNALLFEYGDIDKLASNLEKLMKNDALRNKLSVASSVLADTTFNVYNIDKQIDDLYSEVLGQN